MSPPSRSRRRKRSGVLFSGAGVRCMPKNAADAAESLGLQRGSNSETARRRGRSQNAEPTPVYPNTSFNSGSYANETRPKVRMHAWSYVNGDHPASAPCATRQTRTVSKGLHLQRDRIYAPYAVTTGVGRPPYIRVAAGESWRLDARDRRPSHAPRPSPNYSSSRGGTIIRALWAPT